MPRFLRNCLLSIASLCLPAVYHCAGASGVDARTGIGVFDTLYIAGKTGLAVHGDVFLNGAHVLGEGELQLRGKGDARIVSHQSEVNHLTIHTSGHVQLKGKLAVNKSLTVRSGVFDISDGILDVSDSASVKLLNGSSFSDHGSLTSSPVRASVKKSGEVSTKAVLVDPNAHDQAFFMHGTPSWIVFTTSASNSFRDAVFLPPEQHRVYQ